MTAKDKVIPKLTEATAEKLLKLMSSKKPLTRDQAIVFGILLDKFLFMRGK